MSEFALNALARKRAELAGKCEALQAKLDQMRADHAHLDAPIRIMDSAAAPGLIPPRKPGRKGCDWFGWGELGRRRGRLGLGPERHLRPGRGLRRGRAGRLVLEVLREAQEPLGAQDAARAVMVEVAAAFEPGELRRRGFRLYEAFRPGVPAGERGWGALGELDLGAVRALKPPPA